MSHHIDEFSKSLANESIPRRDTLRLLGAAVAGALLGPFGMKSAFGGGSDPCKTFCNQCSGRQRNQCFAACQECSGNTNRLCGACGSFVCCPPPGQYENGACVNGQCSYWCVDGAADCGSGDCTPLWSDPNNCGACGNVCPATSPYCVDGVCSCASYQTLCSGVCVDLLFDRDNCGACGNVCPSSVPVCMYGVCSPNPCGGGWVWCPHVAPTFGPGCTELMNDNYNCGACGHYCDICNQGVCDPGSPYPD
jgi:hypothetical protein